MLNLTADDAAVTIEKLDQRSATSPTTEPPQCRLCHARSAIDTASPNIYEVTVNFGRQDSEENSDENEKHLIVDVCESVWGVKYDRHEFLPELICRHCLQMLKELYQQRKDMEQRERELLEDLRNVVKLDPKYRPGLNGNPGVFELTDAEEGCVVVDVDPDQLCETSDDEFLGSDGDADGEEEDWYDDDEEEAQNEADEDADVEMPLGMDATQMALMQAHQTVDALAQANAHPKSAFLCQYCDLAFTLQPDCQQHELSAHDPSVPYCCNYCQLRLATRPGLIAHIRELHDAERPYVCAHCNKGFVRRSDLKKHTIVHTGVRPFSCNVCSKSFSRNTNLTKHLRIHSSVKPFVCQKCPRSFQTPLELMKHTRSHSEVKPFQCGRCAASFTRRDKLLMHQQVHTKRDAEQQQQNARLQMSMAPEQLQMPLHPYVETEQQLPYAYQQQLQGQQQPQQLQPQPLQPQLQPKSRSTPKLTRSFRCDVCDKGFQRERDLQRHRALHMDTLFACKLCGQGFNRREQLQRHELEAHGPSYTCSICCITFLHQTELETHLKVHELQHSVAKSTQEALQAAATAAAIAEQSRIAVPPSVAVAQAAPVISQEPVAMVNMKPTQAELNFYSNMIPTMKLGFYSETRPEERNEL
ncbi:zinc finger protein 436 [Drosophila albomicans]|uniref:Zinc finger protein 436 n=1 Tax=Drosophila albomicans TaxID=7291 RepID=A0A6P8W991_DROAB|nr:zinc finger protein 436 [Drosophila albomicans]XP_034100070.1 zinc finger protein 436 [Drosophila albomicans]